MPRRFHTEYGGTEGAPAMGAVCGRQGRMSKRGLALCGGIRGISPQRGAEDAADLFGGVSVIES